MRIMREMLRMGLIVCGGVFFAASALQAQEGEPGPQPVDSGQVQGALVVEPVEDIELDRVEAGQLYEFYLENRDYEQALEAADVELALSEEAFGVDDPAIIPALNHKANALLLNNEPQQAKGLFERAAVLAQYNDGIFSELLYEPYKGVGIAELKMNNPAAAQIAFVRAQHISHRADGVYNLRQLELISPMAQALMAQDQWNEAQDMLESKWRIMENHYGKDSLNVLPAYYEMATWFHDVQQYKQSRVTFRKAIALIEQQAGENDLRLIRPKRGIANTYLEESFERLTPGVRQHEEILEIVNSNPEATIEQRIEAHLELGDWYVVVNEEKDAWQQYRQAWELAQSDEENASRWTEYLAKPRLIYHGRDLSVDFLGYYVVGKEVFYDFEFTIGSTGRPEDIEILGTNLHANTRTAALQSFRAARFRPSIIDGVALSTENYRVRRIYPTDPPDDYGTVSIGGGIGQRVN